MRTDYIICLTSYPPRFANLPRVLDTLWAQTIKPQKVILTVARKDYAQYTDYIDGFRCDVLVVEDDTKVFKKFLPAMEVYCKPDDLVLCVDDDKLYLPKFAEEMLNTYEQYKQPVSGNKYSHNGLKCHCGAASLVFPAAFKGWRKYAYNFADLESSDIFYTMLAHKNGVDYVASPTNWDTTLPRYNDDVKYSKAGMVQRTWDKIEGLFTIYDAIDKRQ